MSVHRIERPDGSVVWRVRWREGGPRVSCSFASLLLHEGRSVMHVARQLGHDARLALTTYGHVIDELDDAPQMPAEDAIREARNTACVAGMSSEDARG